MQISQLGEFGLIDRLTQSLPLSQASTLRGVGDDCAVIDTGGPRLQLITTDMLMEGIHFDLVYTPLRHLGYKAAMVNLSDIYAMGGTPRQLTISMAVSSRFQVEDLDDFYAGLRLACERHGVDIVGGDTTASLTGLAISITAVGDCEKDQVCYRSGAKPTDLVCCSGNLGAAYMGLQLMEREKAVYLSQVQAAKTEAARAAIDFQPDFSGREYLLERLLKPEARRDIVQRLHEAGVHPTSMIDISDGLSSELLHLCKQSQVGCRVYEERIPIDYQTAVAAEEFNMNLSTCALNGGEDYELLFTLPLTEHERVEALEDVRIIGHIAAANEGAMLITRDGNEFALQAQGWNALQGEEK